MGYDKDIHWSTKIVGPHSLEVVSVMSVHECIVALAQIKAILAEYQTHGLEIPGRYQDMKVRLERRLQDLANDQRALRVVQLKSLIAANQPADQKIAAWQEELSRLETTTPA